jgi:hypothetical protein
MDFPPHWKWWSYPFRVTVRTEAGQIEAGWVRCHREGALAAWDSGRVRETKWSDSKKRPGEASPAGLWDLQLDSPPEKPGV